ncbi:NAD(P)H-dependent flavin oxidoreductase [Saccharicrinis sp. FJH62]|uniref:NAD(P)H-dependent flavin oxidoreductase n=1 Tax=Saccharicrinis sp. FJH62 TaxID=3344657 RepID=UPI0035D4F7B5
MRNRITELFKIKYPVIQAGMVWCSGWRLASAVANNGGLGILGAGSMYPEILKENILKTKAATNKPFGVNVPLLYPNVDKIMEIIKDEEIKIVITSAGNPKQWTSYLKDLGVTVVHVVSATRFAEKCEAAGVDAIVAEGFEAGGHNGRDETTTMTLIPAVRRATSLPLIAAGGIGSGESMLAAFALGAEGVQIGSLFAASEESSAHVNFKQKVASISEGDTMLSLKKLTPVRLIRNSFYNRVAEAELRCATVEELKDILGRGRAKRGIFEGDMEEGELEIGQVSATINYIKPVKEIMKDLMESYNQALTRITNSGTL